MTSPKRRQSTGAAKRATSRPKPLDMEFLSGLEKTLSEWNSENDDEAYGDL
jgi:hypothetical protein